MVLLMRRVLIAAAALLVMAGHPVTISAKEGRPPDAHEVVSAPRVLSRSADAPVGRVVRFDFPATHAAIRWNGYEGIAVRYRVLSADGGFGEWQTTSEAHDLEKGTRHSTGVLYVGGALGLEWYPVSDQRRTRIAGLDDGEVFYMDTGSGPQVTTRSGPSATQTDTADPNIVTRAEWGADESLKDTDGGCERSFYPVQQLFVHHTAGSSYVAPYDDDMRAIYAYHTQGNGWCDLGYNFVIAPDGTIFEGRWARAYSDWETHSSENRSGQAVAGAHVAGFNSGSVGISMMGDFRDGRRPTTEARASLVEMLAWETDRHDLQPTATHTYVNPSTGAKKTLPVIAGHKDAGSTECPGTTVYKDLPNIREEVAVAVGAGRPISSVSLVVSGSKVEHGEEITLSGTLTSNGAPLFGRTVILYFKPGRSPWSELSRFVTSADGRFSLSHIPDRSSVFEVAHFGDTTSWGAASGRRKVAVKPTVSLDASGGTFDASGVLHRSGPGRVQFHGDVEPGVTGKVVLKVFKVRADGSEKLVRTKDVALSSGEYSAAYRVKRAGKTYRAVVWYPRTKLLAAARSGSVMFTAD